MFLREYRRISFHDDPEDDHESLDSRDCLLLDLEDFNAEDEVVQVQSRGVSRMEAMYRTTRSRRHSMVAVLLSVTACAWAYSLDQSINSYYEPIVTSYFQCHDSTSAALTVTISVVTAVSVPIVAKFSDITSRPRAYAVVLLFYIAGYVLVSISPGIGLFILGEIFVHMGRSGLCLLNIVVVGELTPLEWRSFFLVLLYIPNLAVLLFSDNVVQASLEGERWRWRHGFSVVIMMSLLGPAIAVLIDVDRQSQRESMIDPSNPAQSPTPEEIILIPATENSGRALDLMSMHATSWSESLKQSLVESGAIGISLFAIGLTLILLPPILRKDSQGGLLHSALSGAFMGLGISLLVVCIVYETRYANFPSVPRRLLSNRTLTSTVIIYSICSCKWPFASNQS